MNEFHMAYGPGPIQVHATDAPDQIRHVAHGLYGMAEFVTESPDHRRRTGFAHLTFTWCQATPYEIQMDFTQPHDGKHVHWTIARSLLRDGSDVGDVRVSTHRSTTWIELSTDCGNARIEVERAWLATLLDVTEDVVPAADEWDAVTFDVPTMLPPHRGGVWE